MTKLSKQHIDSLSPILIARGYRPLLDRVRTPREIRNILHALMLFIDKETIEGINDWLDVKGATDHYD